MLDLALFLMGHPKPTTAFGSAYAVLGKRADYPAPWGQWDVKRFSVEDFGVGLVRFKTGATLLLKASWAANIRRIRTTSCSWAARAVSTPRRPVCMDTAGAS